MTRPKKKRFHTKQQIHDEIDRYKAKVQKHNNAAIALENKADSWALTGTGMVGEINYARSEALRNRRAAARIMEKRLPRLKQKLSEFQTPQIPAIDDGDRSIAA